MSALPPLPAATDVFLSRNRVSDLAKARSRLPAVEVLDLEENRLESRRQLQPLGGCTQLQDLWLRGNPVCDKEK